MVHWWVLRESKVSGDCLFLSGFVSPTRSNCPHLCPHRAQVCAGLSAVYRPDGSDVSCAPAAATARLNWSSVVRWFGMQPKILSHQKDATILYAPPANGCLLTLAARDALSPVAL